ncbi:MAG TPA: FGGY-family carbohydrate kinase, partial [Anaerolineae bacterium]
PVGAIRPGAILDVSGTWEVVLAATEEPLLSPELGRAGMTVEAHVATDLYALWGGAVSADMLEWYRREYGGEARLQAETGGGTDWDYLMAEAAAAPPGSHGVTFLPHMSGGGCPVDDTRSLGAFVGLSGFAGKGDLLRAIVEGLDYQFLHITEAMQANGVAFDRLIAVGGAVRNKFWMQNKADIAGRCIETPEVEDATPLGAAMLAGIGVGIYRDAADACAHVFRPGPVYEPDLALTARYADLFEIYKQVYPALAPVSHQLYGRTLA